jgi:hypothetical protein
MANGWRGRNWATLADLPFAEGNDGEEGMGVLGPVVQRECERLRFEAVQYATRAWVSWVQPSPAARTHRTFAS